MTSMPSGRIRVMIVDDHPLLRNAVRQTLTTRDVEVVADVATAEEALRVAPEVRPDVLLVDIDLPGMDGLELVRELGPRLPATRFVMLSVSTGDEYIDRAILYGAAGYLTKDLSPESLLRAVRGVHRGELAMDPTRAAGLVKRMSETRSRVRTPGADPVESALSDRELQVIRLMATGLTDREIAAAFTISPRTVETPVSSILRKLGARNRVEAARLYLER